MAGTLNDQHFTSTVLQPFRPTIGGVLSSTLAKWCSGFLDSCHIFPYPGHQHGWGKSYNVEIISLMPAIANDALGNLAERSLPVRPLPVCGGYERDV